MVTVDIWHEAFAFDPDNNYVMELLSREEKVKANAFVKAIDRQRYICAHIFLREVLLRYLPEVKGEVLAFEYNAYGKPRLADKYGMQIYFNLSHSISHIYVIISKAYVCGIDVEEKKEMEISEGMAALVFSTKELDIYNTLSPEKRVDMFYRFWTVKEAYLKALGTGLIEKSPSDLDFSHNLTSLEKKSSFKIGKEHYWSESFGDQGFLAFCVLDCEKVLSPNYLSLHKKVH